MKILFVCTSNFDRSPALERHFREHYPQHEYRSAGINKYHTHKKGTHLITAEDVKWADLFIFAERIHGMKTLEYVREFGLLTEFENRRCMIIGAGQGARSDMERYVTEASRIILKALPHDFTTA